MASTSDLRSLHTHIGKAIQFKGDISGGEDVYIDGKVEGTINLARQSVTVGPNGSVTADLAVRDITIQGKLQGQVVAQERIEITQTGAVIGEMSTARIAVSDGAFFKGKIEVVRPREEPKPAKVAPEPEPEPEPAPAVEEAASVASEAPAEAPARPDPAPSGGGSPYPSQSRKYRR